jgi:endoglucanase
LRTLRQALGLIWSTLLLGVIAQSVSAQTTGGLLPSGYFSTSGSQIVDGKGRPVRIASVGWPGGDDDLFVPIGLNDVNYEKTIADMRALGINTIRLPWCDMWVGAHASATPKRTPKFIAIDALHNPDLQGLTALEVTDRIVQQARRNGLKIIFDHHNNDCQSGQQLNGLWFDGKVSVEVFEQDWLDLAKRYKDNDTVIGFDLDNEPLRTANWGDGGPNDWHAEAQRLGSKLQKINPGPLIIVEGIQTIGPEPHMPDAGQEGNLEGVRDFPVVLPVPNKVVYSVHEYPPSTFDYIANRNPVTLVQQMNRTWGYLVTERIAPVWIGEMGSSLMGKDAHELTWADTLLDYMNGKLTAQGGPGFRGDEQGVGGSWWFWGHEDEWTPNGLLASWNGTPRPAQYAIVKRMFMRPLQASHQ